jgi:NAD(P)-dependent dehydrogenase (short-subunit alcohol dehydrogenase family)
MGRAADPDEIAPPYVFFFFAAQQLSSYYTGEVLPQSAARPFPAEGMGPMPVMGGRQITAKCKRVTTQHG